MIRVGHPQATRGSQAGGLRIGVESDRHGRRGMIWGDRACVQWLTAQWRQVVGANLIAGQRRATFDRLVRLLLKLLVVVQQDLTSVEHDRSGDVRHDDDSARVFCDGQDAHDEGRAREHDAGVWRCGVSGVKHGVKRGSERRAVVRGARVEMPEIGQNRASGTVCPC